MVKSTRTDKEIQDSALSCLWQEGAWGENYANYEKMRRRLGMTVKNNGRNTGKQLKRLVSDRMVLKLKQGRTCSLNHLYRQTIEQRLIDADFTI